jgi:hypothetical protein
VKKKTKDVMVDGTPATSFVGYNDQMGDTREVWFIRGGYLYEVTTFKGFEAELDTILQSWHFI